jgi:RNA polymerase-binding transcription factor DksA
VFGRCMSCMDDVERERLQAVPWTRTCAPCEERQDSASPAAQPGATAHV